MKRVQFAPFCVPENLGCIVSFAWLLANEKARNFGALSRLRVSFCFLKNAVQGTIRALSHQKYSIKNNNTVTGLVPVAVFFMPVSVRHHAFSESHLKRIPQPVLFLVQECARRC